MFFIELRSVLKPQQTVFFFLNCVPRTPSVMGILVADRKFFGEIGSLDGGMKIYGGENVELGIRVKRALSLGNTLWPLISICRCFCLLFLRLT